MNVGLLIVALRKAEITALKWFQYLEGTQVIGKATILKIEVFVTFGCNSLMHIAPENVGRGA